MRVLHITVVDPWFVPGILCTCLAPVSGL